MPDFNQSDIQQIASLVASQVVEQLKTAGYQTRDAELNPQAQQGLTASQRAQQQQQAYDNEHNTNANKNPQAQQEAYSAKENAKQQGSTRSR